ncbi:hypothetical protein HOLleu_44294 [Holothuria leucospilota]|uniref:Uncharacterized protein n=1 Tax=Holothuria leucospilota TaxID=206669 RepID=A0A9Q1BAZ5_HOLLE|nr:hypothetical protein HOLleu_44294 [Holothuria leucospilota]
MVIFFHISCSEDDTQITAELKTEVKELKVAVQLIQQQQNRTVQPFHVQEEFVIPEGVVLPVTDLPGLQKLEEELKSNKALQNHLVTSLSEKGGHNLRDVVRRMAKSLLTTPWYVN